MLGSDANDEPSMDAVRPYRLTEQVQVYVNIDKRGHKSLLSTHALKQTSCIYWLDKFSNS